MNTFQLSCFLAVAGSLSFAKAAEQMNVSQPTVTHQIQSLEEELGTKLFLRTTRLVELTSDGEAFLPDAKTMTAIALQARMRFQSSSDKRPETISIGCSSYAHMRVFSEILRQFRAEMPNLHPRLLSLPRERLFHLMDSEQLDLIFDLYEESDCKGAVKYRALTECTLIGVCAKLYPLSAWNELELEKLAEEPLILCDPAFLPSAIGSLQKKLCEKRDPALIYLASSPDAAYMLAQAGYGVALLPSLSVPQTDDGIHRIALLDAPKLSFGVYHRPLSGEGSEKHCIRIAKSYFEGAEGL